MTICEYYNSHFLNFIPVYLDFKLLSSTKLSFIHMFLFFCTGEISSIFSFSLRFNILKLVFMSDSGEQSFSFMVQIIYSKFGHIFLFWKLLSKIKVAIKKIQWPGPDFLIGRSVKIEEHPPFLFHSSENTNYRTRKRSDSTSRYPL